MSVPNDDAQRELERRALRNVRGLVDKIEHTDEADARTQRRILVGIVIGALVLVGAIAVVASRESAPKPEPVDVKTLPPVRAGPPK